MGFLTAGASYRPNTPWILFFVSRLILSQPLYENLVRTAIHSVKPENIATFLGKKLHPSYQGEMGNNFNTRIHGTRIKMYDKFGIILRIETSTNVVSEFQHFREVQQRNSDTTKKVAPMKKNIYSLFPLAGLLKAANRRYLEFISSFDDSTSGIKNLNKVTQDVEEANRITWVSTFLATKNLTFFLCWPTGSSILTGLEINT